MGHIMTRIVHPMVVIYVIDKSFDYEIRGYVVENALS